jgi:signal transduction histidine kinase
MNRGPCLAELITSRELVRADTRVSDIAERFRREPQLEAVAVIDERGAPVGLLDRTKLLLRLSQQYGYALYARAPVQKVVEPEPLILSAREELPAVLGRVLSRSESDLYDPIVVVDDDRNYLGLVSVKQLILHQTTALANATLEQRLTDRRAREAEKVNELKSKFIAHVTHELRAPVNAIIGMVDLLTHSSRSGDVATMDQMLSLLSASATSLRTLITNILDLSKLEAGKMDVVAEEFDVTAMVREVAAMTRVLVGRKPVTVEVIAHAGPVRMSSDSIKLKQILTNLAGNAAKFTNEGQVRFEVEAGADGVAITVRDTGIGIPKDRLSEVFEPFVQADEVHTRRHEGTGLGLSITARLLELIGGRLHVESEPNVGSAFRVHLPNLPSTP